MRKLKLNTEDLAVEQFQVGASLTQDRASIQATCYTGCLQICPNMPATARC